MSVVPAWITADCVNRRIFKAMSAVATAGILVKLIATFKEFAVAGIYGRSDAMDAYLVAALIPGLLINLISESMNQALIPTLVRVRELEGRKHAQQLLSSSMLWTSMMLLAVSGMMALLAHAFFPLTASHFSTAKLALSVRLFYCLLPVVFLAGITSNCTAVLNTTGRFAMPGVAPVLTPIAIMIIAPLFSARVGIWAVVFASLVGALLHAAWVAWMLNSSGYRFSLRWFGMNEATREVAHQFGPILLSSVVASGGLLVDQSMAAMLPAGSVSALVYAGRFVGVVLALLAGAVSTAVVPFFSQMIAVGDWRACRHTLRTWAWLGVLVATPVAAALIASAHFLVRLTFQHGAFGSRDTAVVTPILIMYALQIPFFVCSRVFYRFLVAMRRTDLVFYCGLLNLGLDILLNLALMRWLGVAGIALATSLWTVSTLVFLWYWAQKVLRNTERTAALGAVGAVQH
jgi:putative peptidoglycan lipid II flippase